MRISSDKWTGKEVDKSGKFVRQKNRFDTPFGEEEGQLPVEAGRYRLLWAPVCPWAHRSRSARLARELRGAAAGHRHRSSRQPGARVGQH